MISDSKPKEYLVLLRRSLIFQIKEFFANSTLHGVRYIAESGRPFIEKFMWFFFTASGTVTALIIILSLWEKFQTNPTITGLDTDYHNQQLIFPSVVVCPYEPYNNTKVNDFVLKENGNTSTSKSVEEFLKVLTKLSFKYLKRAYTLSEELPSNMFANSILRNLAFQVKLDCEDALSTCKYRDEEINCCPHFDLLYTDYGICYGFNSRFVSEEKKDVIQTEMHDLFETDKRWALQFLPTVKSQIFVFSDKEYFGFDFQPQVTWDIGQSVEILISMKETYTTEDARQLSIKQRKCIFKEEVKLKYSKEEYTFSGCMRECRIEKSIRLCKCIPPFFEPLPNVKTCSLDQLKCLAKFDSNITETKDCAQCELCCSNTVYDIDKLNKNFQKSSDMITVEYLTWPIVRYKREVLFGWVDLLVSFGGIAGLFLGFSLLSGVEIIYYFTLRACCMLYRNKDELRTIEIEIRNKPPPKFELSLKPQRRRSSAMFVKSMQVMQNGHRTVFGGKDKTSEMLKNLPKIKNVKVAPES